MNFKWYCCVIAMLLIGSNGMAQTAVGTWKNTGPVLFPVNVSGQVDGMGRVCQMKFDPVDSNKMYAVTSSGGLFISTDNSVSWKVAPGTDVLPTSQCSSVCIDYTNNNIIYLSTGDPDYYYDDYGIWKSTDGGNSFTPANTGINQRMAVEIIMDPLNHLTLVAATDDGIWKTTDGGATWTETFTGGNFTHMKMKPGSNNTLYAVTRTDFYRSTDMGSTWTHITSGVVVPDGNDGMRIAVSKADTNRVYLGTTNGYGIILKSTNGGTDFSTIYSSDTQCIVCYDAGITSGSQFNYNFNMTANPLNADEVLVVSHCVWRSTDAGATWSQRTEWYNQVHTDMHDIEFNPYNNNQLFNGNDGGLWLSTDTLATNWVPRSDGMAATEIYHAAQSPLIRQMVSIGSQDNGELYFDGIWKCNRGGDWGARCGFDYLGNATVYYDNGNRRNLLPLGGDNSYDPPYSAENAFHIEFMPANHNIAFIATDSVWRSNNIGSSSPSWTLISNVNENIQDIASSKADSNILYFVTDDNRLFRSDNAMSPAPTFNTYTTPGPTDVAASLATDKYNKQIVYLTCGGSVFRSVNAGITWSNITVGLPGINIKKIIADDYSHRQRLFVCMGSYTFYKDSATLPWVSIPGLPTIPQVTDFMIYNDSTASSILRLSTYGRGVWECNIDNDMVPVADFSADKRNLCPGDTARFYKTAYGAISSVLWNFPGGSPATSTADSPVVVYSSPGVHDASLIVYGTSGYNDTVLKTAYINASNGDSATLREGFEEMVFPPSPEWEMISESGTMWQQQDTVGGYGLSEHCMWFDNYDNSTGGQHDRIIAPKIDLTTALSAYITFNVAYAYYTGYHDSLQVEVSTDCGRTFVPVYERDSITLATAPNTSAFFIPDSTQWRTDTISLNAYIGNSLEIAFDNIGHYGENIYIDNINIVSVPAPTAVNKVPARGTVSIYPNPASNTVTVNATGLTGNEASIIVYNAAGITVRNIKTPVTNGTINRKVNLSNLPAGVYIFKVQSAADEGSYITNVVIE